MFLMGLVLVGLGLAKYRRIKDVTGHILPFAKTLPRLKSKERSDDVIQPEPTLGSSSRCPALGRKQKAHLSLIHI